MARLVEQRLYPPGCQFVDASYNANFFVIDERGQDRPSGLQLLDVEYDVAPNCIVQHVAGLTLHCFNGGADRSNERGQMTGKRGAVLD
jgi:hypothetical protein